MIAHFGRFVNNGAGLEKTLRLIQALVQIAAVFTVESTVRLTTAKLQLALTRRFFRFFGFIGSFQRVSTLLSKGGAGSVSGWLDLAKWTCFSLYFVLEDLTILHAMGVYSVSWEPRVMREANQFWFYALSFSLLGTLYKLLSQLSSHTSFVKAGKKTSKESEKGSAPVEVSVLVKQLVVEACDLLIPASLLKWMPVGDLILGLTMVVSTVFTGRAIWATV